MSLSVVGYHFWVLWGTKAECGWESRGRWPELFAALQTPQIVPFQALRHFWLKELEKEQLQKPTHRQSWGFERKGQQGGARLLEHRPVQDFPIFCWRTTGLWGGALEWEWVPRLQTPVLPRTDSDCF